MSRQKTTKKWIETVCALRIIMTYKTCKLNHQLVIVHLQFRHTLSHLVPRCRVKSEENFQLAEPLKTRHFFHGFTLIMTGGVFWIIILFYC